MVVSLWAQIDEVNDLREKVRTMQVCAQQAKAPSLIDHATEIRLRAEFAPASACARWHSGRSA
jgi:hypothetical protein